ncbi:MAG TPA: putative glycoside hydrolase [Symbiobacteriaceae bacterium]|nr:putative glycoside hydrolase [Symbiobacteriaceae bacterium]
MHSRNRSGIKRVAVWAMVAGSLLSAGLGAPPRASAAEGTAPQAAAGAYQPGQPFISLEQVKAGWAQAQQQMQPPRVKVKGIYLTSSTATRPDTFDPLLALVERTELNAMVVNIKDDWGNVTFDFDHPVARGAEAVHADFDDLEAFTGLLRSKNIYSIARIVTFKDAHVPQYRPELAVHSSRGGIWRDYNSVPWLNPYNRQAWEYAVDIARAAALAGFDEIQFDYVRFPTDGEMSTLSYPGKDGREKAQVIGDFLAYARKELHPYGVWVSADVFGLITSLSDDLGIGHHLEEVSAGVDYLSPMVYPSHYIPGNLGLSHPNAAPYETVYRSMLDAKERWEKAGLTGKVTVRPWLQDFSWGYPYGPAEVRAQIQATYDAGYNEWILWNAANVYTEAALQPPGKE